jgi:hypothetical protein
MNKFYAKTSEEFCEEKEKRHEIYKSLCEKSSELCEKWKRHECSHEEFFAVFKNVDPAYLDWCDGVCLCEIENMEI